MMNTFRTLLAAVVVLAPLAACTTVLLPPNVKPVAPKPTSLAEADRMLAGVQRDRAETEARYAAAEQVCYAKFFVNDCLDQAKEERRERLAGLKAIEIEAEYFQRKATADARDLKVAQAEKAFQEEEARLAAVPPAPPKAVEPIPAPRTTPEQRAAERAAKDAKQLAKDQKMAAQAPANAAAFEQRRLESVERQRRVAEKQAERAREAAAKAAATAAKEAEEKARAAKAAQLKK